MDSDLIEFFGSASAKCPNCGSTNLLFFIETRLKGCMAYACFDCENFQVCGKSKKEIEEFLKSKEMRSLV